MVYADVGQVKPAGHGSNGYRQFNAGDVQLLALRADPRRLAEACRGDGAPGCPILNGLAGRPAA